MFLGTYGKAKETANQSITRYNNTDSVYFTFRWWYPGWTTRYCIKRWSNYIISAIILLVTICESFFMKHYRFYKYFKITCCAKVWNYFNSQWIDFWSFPMLPRVHQRLKLICSYNCTSLLVEIKDKILQFTALEKEMQGQVQETGKTLVTFSKYVHNYLLDVNGTRNKFIIICVK